MDTKRVLEITQEYMSKNELDTLNKDQIHEIGLIVAKEEEKEKIDLEITILLENNITDDVEGGYFHLDVPTIIEILNKVGKDRFLELLVPYKG